MVLLSITPLLDGVLRRDIIAPFHTSGPPLLQFHLAIEQWGYCSSRTATFPIPFPTAALFIVAVPKTTSTSATATGAEYLGTTSVNLYLHGTSGWYFVGGH